MMTEPRCSSRSCIHFEGVRQLGDQEADQVPVCAAFPRGIPEEIAFGLDKHKSARKDQAAPIKYEGPDE